MALLAAAAILAAGQAQTGPTTTSGQASPPKDRTFVASAPNARPRAVSGPPALYGNWRSCQIGGGGYIQRVTYTSDPRILYAHVDVGGIYRSDDGGRRWRMLHGALPQVGAHAVRDLSPDPRDPNRVLALIGDQWVPPQGIYETRDGGRSWARRTTVEVHGNGQWRWTGGLFARDPKNPDLIVAGTAGQGIHRSTDGGRTWSAPTGTTLATLRDAFFTDIRWDRSDSRRIWAAANPNRAYSDSVKGERDYVGGWFLSEDAGKSWIQVAREAPTEFVQDGARPERLIGVFNGLYVRVSDDRGTTWRPYDQGLLTTTDPEKLGFLSDSRFDALASGPGFQLIQTTRGTLYRRNTNETAWRQVLPEGTTQLYEGRPWISEDGPGRYQHFGSATGSITIDPRDPNHLWFTDWYSAYESRDGGKNWNLSMDGMETTVIHTFESDPVTPEIVHLGMADNGYLNSRDGGTTFQSPRLTSNIKAIAVSRQDPRKLVVVGDPGNGQWVSNTIRLSADRGRTWTTSPMTGLPARETHTINTVAMDPRDDRRVYAGVSGAGGGVFLSTDGGATFLRDGGLVDADGLPGDDFFNRDIWIVGREIALNGSGDVVVLSRPQGLVYRREGGRYLKCEGIEGTPNEVAATVATTSTSTLDARRPATGAATGADAAKATAPALTVLPGGAFFVATDRGIYRSENAGRTWTRTLARPVRSVAVDPTNPRRVAAGSDGAVLLSEDGGLSWREVDRGLPDRNFPKVGFGANRLLAGTAGSGAFWLPLDGGAYVVNAVRETPARPVDLPASRPLIGATTFGQPLRLLEDEGFEDARGFASRWTVGYTGRGRLEVASVSGGAPQGGARSLRLRTLAEDSSGSAAARLVSPPRRFRVSGAARSQGKTTEALVGVQAFDADGRQTGFVVLFDARNTETFRRFSTEVELPAGTETANLVATYAGTGSVSLDDLRFETVLEGASDPSTPLPTDLLENGDFEVPTRIARDWIVGFVAEGSLLIGGTPVNPRAGTRALQIRNAGALPAEGAAVSRLKRVPRRMRVEGFVRVEGAPEDARVAVQAFDAEGQQTTFSVAIDARSATEWRAFSTEVELPPTATVAYLVATFRGRGSFFLDDLRLTTIAAR